MKLIERELNALSSSEIRVALLPVGVVPEEALRSYEALVQKYRHVCLATVRSFHHEKQKSPFKHFPWNKGALNFRFLTGASLQPSAMSCLHASRAVLGVIGLCHCPSSPDIPKAYTEFEHICKQFPNSVTVRCFAFDPVDDEMSQNGRQKEHLIMFPKCTPMELEHNVEVFMHDFAAYLLMELQQGMLNLSVGMMSLNTVLDTPELFGYSGVTDEMTKRQGTEEEVRLRRRHTRMQKLFGDWSMLAGSPRDAYDHYHTCFELARFCGDVIWGAAAVEGLAEAKILEALVETGAVAQREYFQDSVVGLLGVRPSLRVVEGTNSADSVLQNGVLSASESASEPPLCPLVGEVRDAEALDEAAFSECGIGYGDQHMWKAIRHDPELLSQAAAFYNEAENVYLRRGVVPLQIEVQMKTIRMLVAFKGMEAKARINSAVTRVLELWPKLKSEQDRMRLVIELQQLLKVMKLPRKRALLLWQALETGHRTESSDEILISLALKSELCTDLLEMQQTVRFLTRDVLPRPFWGTLHKGMIEALLPAALKTGMEIVVWESAATLLRDFHGGLPLERQRMLMDILKRAASQMNTPDKTRQSLGPPPFFQVRNVCHPPEHLKPHVCDELMEMAAVKENDAESAFIFNPYAVKRRTDARHEQEEMSKWVVGEECTLEVYIANPCSVQVKVERLCLSVQEEEGASPRATPMSVAVVLPPRTKPTRVTLAVTPHAPGPLRIIGCHVTLYGVTWLQRFVASLRRVSHPVGVRLVEPEWGPEKNMIVEMDVLPSMPLLKWQLVKIDSDQAFPTSDADSGRSSQAAKEKGLSATVRAGQRLDFKLRVSNVSKQPVLKAKMLMPSHDDATSGQEVPLAMEADDRTLVANLPLSPKDAVDVPVRVLVDHRTTPSGNQNKRDSAVQIRMLYGSDTAGKAHMFGRELCAPLSFNILPSANIVTIQISQHYVCLSGKPSLTKRPSKLTKLSSIQESNLIEEHSRSGQSSEDIPPLFPKRSPFKEKAEDLKRREEAQVECYQFSSEAVLRATIANHDTQVLCVWIGTVPDHQSFHSQQWTPPSAPASHSVVPGQAVQVSCTIPAMPVDQRAAEGGGMEAVAFHWIRSCLCGFWQSVVHQPTFTEQDASPSHNPIFELTPACGSQGTMPIRKEHISRALNPTVLASVIPASVILSVQLTEPYTRSFVNLRELLSREGELPDLVQSPSMEEGVDDEWSIQAPDYEAPTSGKANSGHSAMPTGPKGPNGEVWGIQTDVGELVNCEVCVENPAECSFDEATLTICSERVDESGVSADILFRREGGLNDAGILIIGRTSNVPLPSARPIFRHKFGLCCVMPGLYQVYVCERGRGGKDLLFVQGFKLNVYCK